MENRKIQILKERDKDKIYVLDVSDIAKQTEYYRKMQKIENTRRESAGY
jgi:hypothetical protein